MILLWEKGKSLSSLFYSQLLLVLIVSPSGETGSVTMTSLNFSFQICKMEATSGLWMGLNEMRFDKHLALSNTTVNIQDYDPRIALARKGLRKDGV